MTVTASVTPAGLNLPGPGTLVLRDRKLNPGRESTELSVFADVRWDLSPGVFEAHVPTSRLNFLVVPDPFRETVKHYIWQVINHDDPQPRSRTSRRPSLSS
ncbi:MAG: hypothetical protein QOE61_2822, partial [Micromonosporaceae bacterium]|nr:hypothetical protein [Micromonosporaceae bacterium]